MLRNTCWRLSRRTSSAWPDVDVAGCEARLATKLSSLRRGGKAEQPAGNSSLSSLVTSSRHLSHAALVAAALVAAHA
jgi:hypothetical protein